MLQIIAGYNNRLQRIQNYNQAKIKIIYYKLQLKRKLFSWRNGFLATWQSQQEKIMPTISFYLGPFIWYLLFKEDEKNTLVNLRYDRHFSSRSTWRTETHGSLLLIFWEFWAIYLIICNKLGVYRLQFGNKYEVATNGQCMYTFL